jgi:hypothetical protein
MYNFKVFKHFKVTAEKIALGKANFSNGILKQLFATAARRPIL